MTNVEKVYVIVKGEYSDYHICAVALERNIAEKLRDVYSDDDDEAIIEEYIPASGPESIRVMYTVEIKNGEISVNTDEKGHIENLMDIYNDGTWVILWVYAKDKEHAIKIAQDRRAIHLAKKEGVI